LQLARRHQPNLVVLDIIMPGMDGLTVCREMRQDPGSLDNTGIDAHSKNP